MLSLALHLFFSLFSEISVFSISTCGQLMKDHATPSFTVMSSRFLFDVSNLLKKEFSVSSYKAFVYKKNQMFFLISGNASGTGGASSGGKDGGLSEKINEKIDKCNRWEECKQCLRDAGWSLNTE